jgi:hypothetical protein
MYSRLVFRAFSPAILSRCLTLSRIQCAVAPKLQETSSSTIEPIDKAYSEKIHRLVDEISRLSLVDVMDLNELLKVSCRWHARPSPAVLSVENAQNPRRADCGLGRRH